MTYVSSPTARPKDAPIAMVGRKIPAGTCADAFSGQKRKAFAFLTIIPNVHAVRAILVTAVKTKRKTFSPSAFGLQYDKAE